jgi:2-polyprenyl-3-methyl-5-hydroxy-6-metoxy-1,4-benzoquinol methylase
MNHYGSDLAFIHDDGFGQFAAGGAQELLEELSRIGISAGTVLDIGCGSGITARLLTDAGYSVVGVDL